ncbi:MAG: hypothetical protein U0791_02665 [Gemmataceae bacterium]
MAATEKKLRLGELASLIGVSYRSVNHWVNHGLKGVKLKTSKTVKGEKYVTVSSMVDFCRALDRDVPPELLIDKDEAAVAVARTLAGQTQAGELCEDQSGD